MRLRTTVIGDPSVTIGVVHSARTQPTAAERRGLFVESLERNDTLTVVDVSGGASASVAVFWRRSAAVTFSVVYVAASKSLFVGGGQVVAGFDLASGSLVLEEHPLLFWSFEWTGTHVVKLGEIECLLIDPKGPVVARADVDPPYEIERSPDRYSFASPVYGHTELVFPTADHPGRTD